MSQSSSTSPSASSTRSQYRSSSHSSTRSPSRTRSSTQTPSLTRSRSLSPDANTKHVIIPINNAFNVVFNDSECFAKGQPVLRQRLLRCFPASWLSRCDRVHLARAGPTAAWLTPLPPPTPPLKNASLVAELPPVLRRTGGPLHPPRRAGGGWALAGALRRGGSGPRVRYHLAGAIICGGGGLGVRGAAVALRGPLEAFNAFPFNDSLTTTVLAADLSVSVPLDAALPLPLEPAPPALPSLAAALRTSLARATAPQLAASMLALGTVSSSWASRLHRSARARRRLSGLRGCQPECHAGLHPLQHAVADPPLRPPPPRSPRAARRAAARRSLRRPPQWCPPRAGLQTGEGPGARGAPAGRAAASIVGVAVRAAALVLVCAPGIPFWRCLCGKERGTDVRVIVQGGRAQEEGAMR